MTMPYSKYGACWYTLITAVGAAKRSGQAYTGDSPCPTPHSGWYAHVQHTICQHDIEVEHASRQS